MAQRLFDRVARRRACFVPASLCLALAIVASRAQAADVKKPAPPDPKAIAALNAAAAELVKEAQAAFKESLPKVRDKCDYFELKPNPAITPEIILMGLERSQNGDARIDAYVKWQLLSGLSNPFPDDLAPRALAAYRRSPEPFNHPGLDHNKLKSALFRVGTMKKDRMDDINKGFAEALDKFASDNLYILHYRKDLYGRLPVSGESLMAGVEDIFTRARHGIPAGDFWETVSGSIQGWSLSADGRQRDAILHALEKLSKLVKDSNYKPFVRVAWSDDIKSGGMHWEDQMSIDDNKIQALLETLRNSAGLGGTSPKK